MNAHSTDLGAFLTTDPKGQRLLPYLNQLVPLMRAEQAALIEESAALQRSVDHIKEIVATQQSYAGSSVVAESVDINSLVEDALRINAESMTRHSITVSRMFSAVQPLHLDKHLMLQILVNLIANANQAMQGVSDRPRRLSVRVAFEPNPQRARLRILVEDNGEGIAPENLGRLFEHGFTTRKNGHGFGLHSSALAARAMGGTLCGENLMPGPGAVFTLDLPARLAVEVAA
jgi:signal transduction histidine kinase